jgi:hypothetical protein
VSRQDRHPRFLIHDSAVFDGVNPRQMAGALNLARKVGGSTNAQYIVSMNTNNVPESIAGADWYPEAVRRTIPDTEEGGTFGFVTMTATSITIVERENQIAIAQGSAQLHPTRPYLKFS